MSTLSDPRITILGNSSIGIFGFSTDKYTIVPNGVKKSTMDTMKEHLQNKLIISTIANSHLNGLFAIGNSNSIILPSLVTQDEFEFIESQVPLDVNIHVLNSKITALGNTIICSDDAALVSNEFSSKQVKTIAEYLEVDKIQTAKYLNSTLLGSMIFMTNKGFLTHPLLNDVDIQWISDFFGINGNVVTVNRGMPYPRLGIIANSKGVIVGSDTTGPEILRITETLNASLF